LNKNAWNECFFLSFHLFESEISFSLFVKVSQSKAHLKHVLNVMIMAMVQLMYVIGQQYLANMPYIYFAMMKISHCRHSWLGLKHQAISIQIK